MGRRGQGERRVDRLRTTIDVGLMTNAMMATITAMPIGGKVSRMKGPSSAIERLARSLRPHPPVNGDRHENQHADNQDDAKCVVVPQQADMFTALQAQAKQGQFKPCQFKPYQFKPYQFKPWPRPTCIPGDRGGRAGGSMPRQIHSPARLLVPAILLAALFPGHSVRADARITGEPDAVRVEARNAPVEEVMAALGTSFGLRYRATVSTGRRITGTYEGSLQRVVTRLLDGYNFVMKTSPAGVEVMVYGVVKPGEASLAPKTVQAVPPLATTPLTAQARREERRKRRAN